MKLRPLVLRLLSLTLGSLLALLVAEVILRIWTPESLQFKAVRRSDPVYHHALIPSAHYLNRTTEYEVEVRTNSLGMRDHEYVQPSGKEFRIAVLGDSFMEGVGVPLDSCLSKQLERRLNASGDDAGNAIGNAGGDAPCSYTVFNFGVIGYSPIIEYLVLKNRVLPLHPQLVVLCYDMTDVQDDFLYGEDSEFDSTGAPVRINPSIPDFGRPTHFPRSRLKTWIQENSYVYRLVSDALWKKNTKPRVIPGSIRAGAYQHTVDSATGTWERYFALSQSYVKQIADLCRENGIRFVLTVHPRGHQVSTREWTKGRDYWSIPLRLYKNSAIFPSLEKFAHEASIPFLNMTATFRARSDGHLFYQIDDHWTSEGHAVAADTLCAFLRNGGFLR
jgi:hypothetical protein